MNPLVQTWRKMDIGLLGRAGQCGLVRELAEAGVEWRWWDELERVGKGRFVDAEYQRECLGVTRTEIVYLETEQNRERIRGLLKRHLPAEIVDRERASDVKNVARVMKRIVEDDEKLDAKHAGDCPTAEEIERWLELVRPREFSYEEEDVEALGRPYPRVGKRVGVQTAHGAGRLSGTLWQSGNSEGFLQQTKCTELQETPYGWYLGFERYKGNYSPVIIDPANEREWHFERFTKIHDNLYEVANGEEVLRFRNNLTLVAKEKLQHAGITYYQYSYGKQKVYGMGHRFSDACLTSCEPWGENFLLVGKVKGDECSTPQLINQDERIPLPSLFLTKIVFDLDVDSDFDLDGGSFLQTDSGIYIGNNNRVFIPLTKKFPLYITERKDRKRGGPLVICGRDFEELFRCDHIIAPSFGRCEVLKDGARRTLRYCNYITQGYFEE